MKANGENFMRGGGQNLMGTTTGFVNFAKTLDDLDA